MYHFVFPPDPLDAKTVDPYFEPQRVAFGRADFPSSLVSDQTFQSAAVIRGLSLNTVVVYRGWMVDEEQYRNLASAVHSAGAGLLTSPENYLAAHHLPNWYPVVRDLTPETRVFPADVNLEAELRKLNWSAFFIKDYVKSLKTSAGSLITDPAQAKRVVDDMQNFRGTIEGGICVRRVEQFRPNSEQRYFVLKRRAHAPIGYQVPAIVFEVAQRFDHPFFSVDIAEIETGAHRVVEIGDGQVSDLVGWNIEDFIAMWRGTA